MNSTDLTEFLAQHFSEAVTDVSAPRERRVFGTVTAEKLVDVVAALREWGMAEIGTITGLDSGSHFELIYHMYNNEGLLLNLKVFIPREEPRIPTVSHIYPGVFLYERELMDMFGIVVDGTPPGRRYPLPDDWPEGNYPLRKDWKGFPEEGVKQDG
ncbi:NADH:ubiquinone oxidoreductase subunit C [Hydrogenispora ethanolica]|uniref:NADH:ubiquinone oxidoreductase subunit C n=1 Tax=Hydrogenispora ethanolica TaxID=1082276 RepID=A0A4R1R5X5_HYDET|nr:NADH-quinone oxidoreductase subunit C [Hydrogenispora ethanolica]TCL60888.1 NADH:ubiquinone oxidoreductase subunit C [Hydrogenispora ethanolica]